MVSTNILNSRNSIEYYGNIRRAVCLNLIAWAREDRQSPAGATSLGLPLVGRSEKSFSRKEKDKIRKANILFYSNFIIIFIIYSGVGMAHYDCELASYIPSMNKITGLNTSYKV